MSAPIAWTCNIETGRCLEVLPEILQSAGLIGLALAVIIGILLYELIKNHPTDPPGPPRSPLGH